MEKLIDIDGEQWRVFPLPEESHPLHRGGEWHLVRVRFEPVSNELRPARTTWLRCEHDVPIHDAVAQYEEGALVEAFLAAEEEEGEAPGGPRGRGEPPGRGKGRGSAPRGRRS